MQRVDEHVRESISRSGIDELNRLIADPAVFCGGGAAAAISASSASALAILVLDINLRRRRNAAFHDDMSSAIETIRAMQRRFYRAADEDVRLLNELIESQKEARRGGPAERYLSALEAAAREPLVIARDCLALLTIVDANLPRASRFTVSDFGAAGALAAGALRAALLMTDVNVAVWRNEPGADIAQSATLAGEAAEVSRQGDALAGAILSRTLEAILGEHEGERR